MKYKFSELLRDLVDDCREQGYNLNEIQIALQNEYTRIQNVRRKENDNYQHRRIN